MARWFNPWGLSVMVVLMIPNLVFALKSKDGFTNLWHNRFVEVMEQVGRYGCFALMIFNIPGTYAGWSSHTVFLLYLAANFLLLVGYCLTWFLCFGKSSVFRAFALSILPSCMFLTSGLLIRSVPLLIAALLFAPCHILLSYKNASLACKKAM